MEHSNSRYKIKSASLQSKDLHLSWEDGHKSTFHSIWLRHQCTCDHCGTPVSGVRGIRIHHIPEDIAPSRLGIKENRVELIWNNDGHRSVYEGEWLRDHCYSKSERSRRKHRPTLWTREIAKDPPTASLEEAEADPSARLRMLEAVRDYGFCKITDAPTEASQAHRLIEAVGPQRLTHYGTYVLTKKKTVDNVGDTTGPLDPHSDETYRLSTIGITVFQVLNPSTDGGASTLVDGFEAARRLLEQDPESFDLLTKVPITGQRYDAAHNSGGQSRWYLAHLPLIKLDHDGDVSGVRLNERQISPLALDGDLIEPTYRALRQIFDILYDPDLLITFDLKAGEGLLFDNQRLLHGRTGFIPEEPPRSVLTSSVNLEDFHSSLRLLEKELGVEGPPLLLSQGMAV